MNEIIAARPRQVFFNRIAESELIFLRTANSIYQITLVSCADRHVKLRGGRFGDIWLNAVYDWKSKQLCIGANACFFVESKPKTMIRLITSTILELNVVSFAPEKLPINSGRHTLLHKATDNSPRNSFYSSSKGIITVA